MKSISKDDQVSFSDKGPSLDRYQGVYRGLVGVATGETSTEKYPEGQIRAEVKWPDGSTRWPLLSLLELVESREYS